MLADQATTVNSATITTTLKPLSSSPISIQEELGFRRDWFPKSLLLQSDHGGRGLYPSPLTDDEAEVNDDEDDDSDEKNNEDNDHNDGRSR